MKALNNNITITEANTIILKWITSTYGQRDHGTTRLKPYEEFIRSEQPLLLPLPLEPFEAAFWKEAIVHPDHFIQVQMKRYSLPSCYVGKKVFVKVSASHIEVYYNNQLIKIHPIPKGSRQTDLNDFPENMKAMMNTGLVYALRKNAGDISPELGELITRILSPHAFINMRKAQGILSIASKYPNDVISLASKTALKDINHLSPKAFSLIIEKIIESRKEEEPINISEETSCFLRQMDYFINLN